MKAKQKENARNLIANQLWMKVIEIVNQVEQEYNNDFCEWQYDEFEDGWQTSCGAVFSLCDSDKEITNFCPCCGKKIKVIETKGNRYDRCN